MPKFVGLVLCLLFFFASTQISMGQDNSRRVGPGQQTIKTNEQLTTSRSTTQNGDSVGSGDKATKSSPESPKQWLERWSLSDKIAAIVAIIAFLQFVALIATWGVMLLSARRQLRAYVSVTPKLVYNWRKANHIGISFELKNHGQTPAFVSHYDFSMDVIGKMGDELPFISFTQEYKQRNTLFPQSDVPVRLFNNRHLNKGEIAAIETGASRFHIWGIAYYRDAFGRKRTTYFSFSFGGADFATSMRKPPGPGWNWENGQRHNEAT